MTPAIEKALEEYVQARIQLARYLGAIGLIEKVATTRATVLAAIEGERRESALTAARETAERWETIQADTQSRALKAEAESKRLLDALEAAEREAERQKMFWESIRDARVERAEARAATAREEADALRGALAEALRLEGTHVDESVIEVWKAKARSLLPTPEAKP